MGAWAAIWLVVLEASHLAVGRAQHRPAPIAEARAALDARDLERARILASEAALLEPRNPAAWLALGLALFRAGRPADAAPAFRHVTELDGESAIGWFNYASALYQSGVTAPAVDAYHRAAALDGKLAALARYDAALAARDTGRSDEAERDFIAAASAARAHGQDELVHKAESELATLADASERALAKQGKAAVKAGHAREAVRAYRAALEHARRRAAGEGALAELAYGLGHALLRDEQPAAAATVFAEAARLRPHDPDFQLMLGIAHFRALDDAPARDALKAALALGLSTADVATARAYLEAIARDRAHDRLTIDLRVGGGWDSNVPQSAAVVSAGSAALPESDAGFLSADLDVVWRFFGRRRNGLLLSYRFDQLAYLSSALDTYSLQEHDLAFDGEWTPHHIFTVEGGVEGFVVFSGVQTFGTFQAGVTPRARILLHEGHSLETQLRYAHVWKTALDPNYDYLGGNRDEASIGEEWRPKRLRLYLGYQLTSERIGVENVPLHQILFPLVPRYGVGTPEHYNIPYSYTGHEVRALAEGDPHRDVRLSLDLRYEKLLYTRDSFIRDALTGVITYRRSRADDRFTASALVRWYLPKGFDLTATYTLVLNRSNIDFRNQATRLDYDDKNYLKHVVGLEAAWRY